MTFVTNWKLSMVAAVAVTVYAQAAPAQQFSSSNEGGAVATPVTGQTVSASFTPFDGASKRLPFEYGALVQGGVGLTENRDSFRFIMAGAHAGKVLVRRDKPGFLKGNFEYAVELFPYWQSFTPKFQRYSDCVAEPSGAVVCPSTLFETGGTYSGVTLTPIILRWNFTSGRRFVPWVQGAGGVLWTNHKYPAFGSPVASVAADGPDKDTSVWNFTPQGGVGLHYFINPRRSIDFGANAVHISSASLGDKNPGVNASVQFSLGYTFWK